MDDILGDTHNNMQRYQKVKRFGYGVLEDKTMEEMTEVYEV